jgi:hypothetical protein
MSTPKIARVTLATHQQTLDSIHSLVATIVNMAGCLKCGRLLRLDLQFSVDPPPDLAKQGVISVEREGF